MGGRLLLVVIAAGLLIYITGTLSNQSQEAEDNHLSYSNVRNIRSASKEDSVLNKKQNGESSKEQNSNKNGRQRNKKKNIKRKKKTYKIKNAKKIGSKNKIRQGKIMQHRRKQKQKDQKANRSDSRQSQTCSDVSEVGSTCLENAQFVLVFEANQVTNYLKQSRILISHKRITSSKQGKKGAFEEAALHMLWAVGGNISDPKCGSNDTSLLSRAKETRDLQSSLSNYEKLKNCSAAIQEACTTPNKSYNVAISEKIKTCTKTMEEFKDKVASCFDLQDPTTQCACWDKAKVAMDDIKKLKCATKANQVNVTVNKKACTKVFTKCKKMEDESVELIYKCMDDHSMRLINQTAESLHSGAMKDTAKLLAEVDEKN